MKISVLQEKLKQGLGAIERVPTKSSTLPILNTVLVQAKKNFLNLTVTDLEIAINWWTLVKTEKEGEVAVPFSPFSGFIGLLPNQKVTLQKTDETLNVECANYKTQVKTLPTQDFPIVPDTAKDNYIEISAAPFCRGLEQVVDIASVSQARPEISGIYFSLQKDVVKLAATDSFRLGEKTLFLGSDFTFSKNLNQETSFIVPQKTVKEIISIFGQKDGRIKIYFSANQILLERQMAETLHPEIRLFSKLIEGDYPAYQDIIPGKNQTQVVLPRNDFLNHLRAAAIFGSKINEIKLKIVPQKSQIEFLSQNPDAGLHHSFLTGKIKGESLEVSFNHRFLVSGLTGIKGTEVVFELNKEESPAVLRPLGDDSYLYVVMPIKAN